MIVSALNVRVSSRGWHPTGQHPGIILSPFRTNKNFRGRTRDDRTRGETLTFKLRNYYQLAKPGIIYGNLLTAAAGFFLASKGIIDGWLLLSLLVGIGTVIGSACVLNNVLDRGIDKKMSRTKTRALVTGEISIKSALVYAGLLGVFGFSILGIYVNWLTLGLGAFALFFYVVVYGIAKRTSVHGTLVGAIPGAIPPVAGYAAVTNHLDIGAGLLFLALVTWQMPHFYAIAIYRKKEYEAAGIPVLSVKQGIEATKLQIFVYLVAFIFVSLLFTYFGYTDIFFAVVMILIGFVWLMKARHGFRARDSDKWARSMFLLSLKVLLVFCLLLSVEAWLP